jgi:hypothetical protein
MIERVQAEAGACLEEAFAAPQKGVLRAFTMVFNILQVRSRMLWAHFELMLGCCIIPRCCWICRYSRSE